ncbi:MAG: glutathione peroxidase [Saprospiraceae bacterium]|nr:glutathione peroxidase [Saprospiraceae bacterium]
MGKSIYQFEVQDVQGNTVSLEDYSGKVLLIINTASRCGFTPQLKGMEEIHEKYKDQGFSILAFPSNDFGSQEPLEGAAIQEFCQLNYASTYPIFKKIKVTGENADPLYQFLQSKDQNGKVNSKAKWNFHKYLINKQGEVVDYFLSTTRPNGNKINRAVKRLLN